MQCKEKTNNKWFQSTWTCMMSPTQSPKQRVYKMEHDVTKILKLPLTKINSTCRYYNELGSFEWFEMPTFTWQINISGLVFHPLVSRGWTIILLKRSHETFKKFKPWGACSWTGSAPAANSLGVSVAVTRKHKWYNDVTENLKLPSNLMILSKWSTCIIAHHEMMPCKFVVAVSNKNCTQWAENLEQKTED